MNIKDLGLVSDLIKKLNDIDKALTHQDTARISVVSDETGTRYPFCFNVSFSSYKEGSEKYECTSNLGVSFHKKLVVLLQETKQEIEAELKKLGVKIEG